VSGRSERDERAKILDTASPLWNEFSAGRDDRQYSGVLDGPLRHFRGKATLAHRASSVGCGNLLRNHSIFSKASEKLAPHRYFSRTASSKDHNKVAGRQAG